MSAGGDGARVKVCTDWIRELRWFKVDGAVKQSH